MVRPTSPLHRRNSTSARSDTSNVFADRYEVDNSPIDTTPADGFGLWRTMSRRVSVASDDDEPISSVAAHYTDDVPAQNRPPREDRNSIRKSGRYLENPFRSLDDDNAGGSVLPTRSESRTAARDGDRSASPGMRSPLLQGSGPASQYQGPSHNYDGYAQNTTLTHTSTVRSTMTTQTAGRQSLHGPAHPYNMYPQNVDEDDMDDNASQADLGSHPLGFPQSMLNVPGSRYRHDADNLSEQLPPYSEYPENGAPKHVEEVPEVDEVALTPADIPLVRREPQSMSDGRRRTRLSGLTEDNLEEKDWSEKSWREKRRTKFCGIPFIWIVVVGSVAGFIIVVLAAALGGFYGAQAKDNKADASTLIDARPIDFNLPPLPTGTYQLQLSSPQDVQAECITDQSQAASWDCGISAPGSLGINVDFIPGNNGRQQGAQLIVATDDHLTGYGTDIPHTVFTPLIRVKDMDAPTKGPAFQFQAVYTKIVVAAPDTFQPVQVGAPSSSTSGKSKRSWSAIAKPGDQPWVCYWNNTLIEGFIYVESNSTSWYGDGNSTASDKQGLSRRWPISSWTHPTSPAATSSTSSAPPSAATVVSAAAAESSTGSTTGSSTVSSSTSTQAQPSCTYTPGVSSTSTAGSCPPPLGNDTWSKLDLYPHVVKIEERRIPGDTSKPYCQKMQVMNDNTLSPVNDPATQEPFIVQISENSPSMDAYNNVYKNAGSGKVRRDQSAPTGPWRPPGPPPPWAHGGWGFGTRRTIVNGACHCQWLSGDASSSMYGKRV